MEAIGVNNAMQYDAVLYSYFSNCKKKLGHIILHTIAQKHSNDSACLFPNNNLLLEKLDHEWNKCV